MQHYTQDNSGRLTFNWFVKFLCEHKMKLAGSEKTSTMFDEVEEIHGLYEEIVLHKARCKKFIKFLTCLRGWSDEKSRLKKILEPEQKSDKVSTMSLITNANDVYSQIKQQLNFLSKCYVANTIYWASLLE